MQRALVFFLAVLILTAIVYAMPKKEGFVNLMGVNWTSMNEGTPAALYTKLPIQQPKMVSVAEAGVGNIQPSPPPASDLPTAPANLRSKENPNPYRDPVLEPARYIRILAVKEDLQAFFGFQAQALDTRSDPSIQIPLNRARADMAELIDVQSVMERNPGIQSRITQKHLDDIQANLRYLRAMLNDLEASGAIQPTALEGFTSMDSSDAFLKKSNEVIKAYQNLQQILSTVVPPPSTQAVFKGAPKGVNISTYITAQIANVEGQQFRYSENSSADKYPVYAKLLNRDYIQEVNSAINSSVVVRTGRFTTSITPLDLTPRFAVPSLFRTTMEGFTGSSDPLLAKLDEIINTATTLKSKISYLRPPPTAGTVFKGLPSDMASIPLPEFLDNIINSTNDIKSVYPTVQIEDKYLTYAKNINSMTIDLLNSGLSNPVLAGIASSIPKITPLDLTPPASSPMPTSGTLPAPTLQPELVGSEPRASLRQLQEFQIKVVVEIQRLNASGTSDPVVQGRLNVLYRIKNEVDDVIEKLQTGFYTADTVPIFESDIEKALPVLGNTSAPVPQLLQKTGLPPAIASLLPAGGSPRDNEMAAQINNVVKGYMKNLFEGVSWGLNLNVKYDNPNIASLQAKTAEANAQLAGTPSTGVPGVRGTGAYEGADLNQVLYQSDTSKAIQTNATYEYGLPGSSVDRVYPLPTAGGLDWKTKSQQIAEQIRRRGMNPVLFGALPENAQVSDDFSWRGYARMMCTRLNASMDPGLAITVGCPPENWSGWKD